MMPILFEFTLFGWDLSLPTYGVLLAVGFIVALRVALRQARRAAVAPEIITDLWILSLLAGVIGAKLLLYLLDWRFYLSNPAAILSTLRSAGVWYGGLILALIANVLVLRRKGLDAWAVGDIAAPAIVVGQAIGRLGCLAAGCCYGRPSSLPWAVTFSSTRAHEITGVPLHIALHPTQIYHALADLLLFVLLILLAKRKRFDGQILLTYLILYSIGRAGIEFLRDDPRGAIAGFSTSQVISAVVFLVAIPLYAARRRMKPAAPPATTGSGRRSGR